MSHGFFQITQKIFLKKNGLLLVCRDKKSGHGDLPGGRMDQEEFFMDWMRSLEREVREELGKDFKVSINPKPILIHKHRVNDGNHPCIIIGYEAEWISGEIQISDEHDFFEWVDPKNFKPETLFSEYMLETIEEYLKNHA